MREKLDFRKSIYLEMVALLLAAVLICLAFFGLLQLTTDFLLDSFVSKTDFNRKQSLQYAAGLQTYIDEKGLNFEDLDQIDEWLQHNPAVVLHIYDDDYLVFDSVNGVFDEPTYSREEEEAAVWENYFVLNFADKAVEISLYGNFDYALYNTALYTEIAVCFLLFLAIFLAGIGKKTKYLVKLREEIELLEGGSLDYPITVLGKDELADFAAGLDSMRISFRSQIKEAERISQTNQAMITQISHDLRTPLTAVTLYAEILQNRSELSETQKQEYLDKILKKVSHMKDLSDHLLEYSTELQVPPAAKLEWLTPREAFFDELSELCVYLEQQGFHTKTKLFWDASALCVNDEYIARIFNNISSNILRYADNSAPVVISSEKEEKMFVLSFINRISPISPAETGNGIGIRSIETMMQELGGTCEVFAADELFELRLSFRLS